MYAAKAFLVSYSFYAANRLEGPPPLSSKNTHKESFTP